MAHRVESLISRLTRGAVDVAIVAPMNVPDHTSFSSDYVYNQFSSPSDDVRIISVPGGR